MKRSPQVTNIRTEGGLLPAGLLVRVASLDKDLDAVSAEDYHLAPGERITEAIDRSWNRLVGAWEVFAQTIGDLAADDRTATEPTRRRWSLVLFQELGYGQLQVAKAAEVSGKSYAISHSWGAVPVHLVGARVELDHRTPGVAGASTMSPHGLVQEFLNRSDEHLWGFVSNGLRLRLLRDNAALTRQAFVEFDLEAIFTGQAYADFVRLWLVCHESRLASDPLEKNVLERWMVDATRRGIRALDQLRDGVESAIAALGEGFLTHRENQALRQLLRGGDLSTQDYYRQLLRLAYRLIFLLVAEDRDLLLDTHGDTTARERYLRHYSLSRVRLLADARRGGPHPDVWRGLRVVFAGLGSSSGLPELALPPLGSFLWSERACPDLDAASIANRYLLSAMRSLTSVQDGRVLRSVDYRNLGSEELGSIYESLLELHPQLSVDGGTFSLATAAGNERKTTGSYYTPTALIIELLDSTLDPLLAEAVAATDPESSILNLRVLDPACGSGHFLIAAAHRIAKRLASVRTGDAEPSPAHLRRALRDVIERCVHGVDLNEMAVELCKVSLWMEAMEPGKPLSFLDHRIVCGNSLLSTTPRLIAEGIPEAAFKPVEGDDRRVALALKGANERERRGQGVLNIASDVSSLSAPFSALVSEIDAIGSDRVADVREKELRWTSFAASRAARRATLVAQAWCAAFMLPKSGSCPPITDGVFRRLREADESVDTALESEIHRVAARYRFMDWQQAFPDTLAVLDGSSPQSDAGWYGGFDLVIGNPPWVSFSGRQAAPVEPHERELLKFLYPPISPWPSTHAAFLVRGVSLLRSGGRLGMVLPLQVLSLDKYTELRSMIADRPTAVRVVDVGEDAFQGVSQRVGLFVLNDAHTLTPGGWTLEAGESLPETESGEGATVGSQRLRSEVLATLSTFPSFPSEAFTDPGVHTGNVSKLIVSADFPNDDARYVGVREGKDIAPFRCGPPRKRLWVDPELVDDQYCRIQSLNRYVRVPVLLRQTADRPIACRHLDRTYFRNSLIACEGVPGFPDEVLVAILNSNLIRLCYQAATLDSGQRAFPQVKVKALRRLPLVPASELSRRCGPSMVSIGERLTELVRDLEGVVDPSSDKGRALVEDVNQLVCRLYSVDEALTEEVARLDDILAL